MTAGSAGNYAVALASFLVWVTLVRFNDMHQPASSHFTENAFTIDTRKALHAIRRDPTTIDQHSLREGALG
ncbi:hypothetical protein SNOG_06602 [Parastagonospora nodorum SN15]|uniref:Uncharacterized protein n=1 Tax=Phaeosphaeria nodorum (strain SN15 / ATCC MYA-4574 / FGSC 10173) TaxID=321614 RepID=Q0UNR2_PHANO|nr:hypothetical protein SNOG_06602 [Parastagonospora nodorum SN15]EAT86433.1 hypothetical protein SNOG_06602 [Parastagonospora nodorum SN15]